MKKQLLTGLFTVFALAASAQSNEWRNPQVNAVIQRPDGTPTTLLTKMPMQLKKD